MQDRYTGDIGDYLKLAILRRMTPGHRLGVLWWLYPDEAHNADGKHIAYLADPSRWRSRDPELFDVLKELVDGGRRSVTALEDADILPGATFFNSVVPTSGTSHERRQARVAWLEAAIARVSSCNVVFLDPDNGLETVRFDLGRRKAGKSVALSELEALRRPGRTIIVYHHQTRMPGGHEFELTHWGQRMAARGFTVDALRASAYSARAFFFLDASADLWSRAEGLALAWGSKLTWHPNLG